MDENLPGSFKLPRSLHPQPLDLHTPGRHHRDHPCTRPGPDPSASITSLTVNTVWWDDAQVSLAPLHTLSPSLKSLCLICDSIPLQEILDLICSIPSLEDLSWVSLGRRGTDIPNIPSTSPKFTGSLHLSSNLGTHPLLSQLLALPGGLRFSQISVRPRVEDGGSITELVSACRDTLESFTIFYQCTGSFLSTRIIYQLTNTFPPVVDSEAFLMQLPLDFSKATKLKSIRFLFGRPSVRWISVALQTIKSKNLEYIAIHQGIPIRENREVGEELLPEWHELDRLLVQFWTSLSIYPDLVDETGDLREIKPALFPELTKRGL